ncbi:hypothetical protein [Chryseobacterium sp. MFBS3-17]|uniref:hypothetical protein n=1 Tax=Chryseobacterium sp. MFBS3-17 TaxID=2886689 RepID=UPI001D0E31E8|nr:hypothetical protein [Chryseobacterium sp. MFBS3-17]MCC2590104.1 hypothetical protein [Chryseobacterium sp. MFBS3-17]
MNDRIISKLYIVVIFITTISVYSQNKEFTINDEGLSKFVVSEIPGTLKDEAYRKSVEWVNRIFNTPEKVIKGSIENEYLRIEGISKTAWRAPAIGGTVFLPIKYEIEISFKDNRYKFEIISLQEEEPLYPQFASSPFSVLNLSKKGNNDGYNRVRKLNGEFRSRYKYVSDLPQYFNNLNTNLQDYILNGVPKNEDW